MVIFGTFCYFMTATGHHLLRNEKSITNIFHFWVHYFLNMFKFVLQNTSDNFKAFSIKWYFRLFQHIIFPAICQEEAETLQRYEHPTVKSVIKAFSKNHHSHLLSFLADIISPLGTLLSGRQSQNILSRKESCG